MDPASVIEVSIWLKPHNKAGLDALAKDLYDPTSSSYRHWLSRNEFASRFAPTEQEAKTVQDFFTGNNLKIVSVGPNNFYVRARGSVSDISRAMHVSLHNYQVDGKVMRGNTSDPRIVGAAAPLVAAVAGLDNSEYTHPLVSTTSNLKPPSTPAAVKQDAVAAASAPVTSGPACFPGTASETLTTGGGVPTAVYAGNSYTNSLTGCGYTPDNIQDAYRLKGLYVEGYDGTGQTIVIIDWCGSPTITQDVKAFSQHFHLPALKEFNIIPTGVSYCSAPDPEINIDVEWSHAVAPGAAIDLVVPPTASFQDVDQGFFYAVNNQLGNVISGSYGSEEYYTSASVLDVEDLISETAAVLGIAANFSTGDGGDFTDDFPQYLPASVSAPADSPYATGIGGVSLALNANSTIAWQTGWGTNINLIQDGGYVSDPPNDVFFNFGSGGGESAYFEKPSYQSALPGAGRQLPDISWLADPYTGATIAISEPFVSPEIEYPVYGGTSLACPMFSALWAIANQEAGEALGQAAPYLYKLGDTAITDILPHTSATNVTGKVTDANGTTSYSADYLAYPYDTTKYESVLWNIPLEEGYVYLVTFGTDSGLTTTKGWDNTTGLGVPNGKAFADSFKP